MTKPFSRFPLFFLSVLIAALPARAQERSIVPLKVVHGADGGGRAYVTMRFGNVMGPMRLDTAASTSRVKLAPWNESFPALGASVSTGATGAATRCEDVEATNVEMKAAQGDNIGRAKYRVTRCATSDGDDLLGLDFFKGARFSLDLEGEEMVFFPPRTRRIIGRSASSGRIRSSSASTCAWARRRRWASSTRERKSRPSIAAFSSGTRVSSSR